MASHELLRIHSRMSTSVVVSKSAIDKKGVFATRKIQKGEMVLQWHPQKLTKRRMQNLVREEKQYVNCIDGAFFLMQPPERFVNHSCDPNSFVHDFKL